MKMRYAFLVFGLMILPGFVSAAPVAEQSVDMVEIMKPGALPELSVGAPTALPVVEYFSVTCSHCAAFHRELWPKLKASFVDTGKVRFIFREFVRNPLDIAAFTLARCIGNGDTDKTLAAIELELLTQSRWAYADDSLPLLLEALRPSGLSHDAGMTCLKDNALIDKVRAVEERADKVAKISGTPTFAINGKTYSGELTEKDFADLLKPLIP